MLLTIGLAKCIAQSQERLIYELIVDNQAAFGEKQNDVIDCEITAIGHVSREIAVNRSIAERWKVVRIVALAVCNDVRQRVLDLGRSLGGRWRWSSYRFPARHENGESRADDHQAPHSADSIAQLVKEAA